MERTVNIGGRACALRTSAALPREYRMTFKRDIFADMQIIAAAINATDSKRAGKKEVEISPELMTIFENITFAMFRHANSQAPANIEDWLAGFDDPYAIYNVLPDVLDMWMDETEEQSVPKKKAD